MPFSAHHRVTGLVHAGPALLWLVLLALSLPLLPAASRCRAAGSTDAYPAPPTVAELRGLIEQAGEPGYTRSVKVRWLELPLPFDVDSVRGGREVSRGALSIRKGRIHLQRLEDRRIPDDFDYGEVVGLRAESREKLDRVRPISVGQASRISGVTPADVQILLAWVERLRGASRRVARRERRAAAQ